MVVRDYRIGCLGTADLVIGLQRLEPVMHCEAVVHEQAQFLQHTKDLYCFYLKYTFYLLDLISRNSSSYS